VENNALPQDEVSTIHAREETSMERKMPHRSPWPGEAYGGRYFWGWQPVRNPSKMPFRWLRESTRVSTRGDGNGSLECSDFRRRAPAAEIPHQWFVSCHFRM